VLTQASSKNSGSMPAVQRLSTGSAGAPGNAGNGPASA
jgi:hypothetical protein